MRKVKDLFKYFKTFFTVFFLFIFSILHSQSNEKPLTGQDLENQKERVKQLVQFFEYTLNIVGNDTTPTSDKEAVLNTAFLKIFKDSKVQVEDDLDQRSTVTNKNIKSYLQDVDYFFTNAKFNFAIQDISYNTTEKNRPYFKVTLSRHLEGSTLSGDNINNTKKRYIEVNYEPKKKDLKIVSVYSSQISESEELKSWWNQTPEEWKKFLLNKPELPDTISIDNLRSLTQLTKIDISGNTTLQTLSPLSKLENLTELKMSGSTITDLTPLLDLNKLEILDISSTGISSLLPLSYSSKLKELNFSNTQVHSISVLKDLKALEKLYVSGNSMDSLYVINSLKSLNTFAAVNSHLTNVDFLSGLVLLQNVDVSQNDIKSLSFAAGMKQLSELDISSTSITDLSPLQNCLELKILKCNSTNISSVEPLAKLPVLEKVYCDKTSLDRKQIATFVQSKPNTLLVFQSEDQLKWWNALPKEWKFYFKNKMHFNADPDKEQIATFLKITEVDISNTDIDDLSPLRQLLNLKTLKANKTKISYLNPLENSVTLEVLEISNTPVKSLDPLKKLSALKTVKCDGASITDENANQFRSSHPKCTLIYKTNNLTDWWNALPDDWKSAMKEQKGMSALPETEALHKLILSDTLVIKNKNIGNLEPLKLFQGLKFLVLSNTQLQTLKGIDCASSLQSLQCTLCPLSDLGEVGNLHELKVLDCSNTAITKTKQLLDCKKIEILKINGTKVSSLKWLVKMNTLKQLDISNTKVCRLSPLKKIPLLERIACYNTRLSKAQVRRFLKSHEHCAVRYY